MVAENKRMFSRKPKKLQICKGCRERKEPYRFGASVCSISCAEIVAKAKTEKDARRMAKAVRAMDKTRREALKSRSDYLKEAQVAWNRYVRMRDFGKPCASCGVMPSLKPGGHNVDCSHYRSVGSAPHMRFHLHNAAAACVKCNRDKAGNVVELRKGLISRIGVEKIEAVESDNRVRKFDIPYLMRIKRIFTKKANRLYNIRKNKVAFDYVVI